MFTYFLWHWLSIVEWRWLQCLSLWVLVSKGIWIIRGSGWFWLALFEFHCSWVYFSELSLELIDREDIRNPTAWLIRSVQEALDKLLACSYLLMCVIRHDSIAYLRVSSLKSDLMCSYLIKQNGTTRHVKYKYCQNYSILCFFYSGLVVKRRMNKESSRMSRAQEKEMDQDRMVEDGNRMEEIQIEHDGDRMTLMDLDIGENLSAADTRRSHPGLPDPSNGPSTTITGSGEKYINIPSGKYIYVHKYVYICVYTYLCKMDEYRYYAGLS